MDPVSVVSSLKIAFDMIQKLRDQKLGSEIQAIIIDLQAKILEAQQGALQAQEERSELKRKLDELQKEIDSFESWEAEKQAYQLKEVSSGVFTYIKQQKSPDDEPTHWLCANCFNKRFKSVLQKRGNILYECQNCKSQISVKNESRSMDVSFPPRRGGPYT